MSDARRDPVFEAARGEGGNRHAPPGAYRVSRTYFDLLIAFGRENNCEADVADLFTEMKHTVVEDLLRRLKTGRRADRMPYATPMGDHGMLPSEMRGYNRAIAELRGETQ